MALAIMIATFGCANGLVLAGARAYYAMARDGLFFARAGVLNKAHVPGWSLLVQGIWSAALVLPRTYNPKTHAYGNLYGNLLDYVISAALLFYILTIAGVFRLRRTRPDAERPYRVAGYPFVPALYMVGAAVVLVMLFAYRPATTWRRDRRVRAIAARGCIAAPPAPLWRNTADRVTMRLQCCVSGYSWPFCLFRLSAPPARSLSTRQSSGCTTSISRPVRRF
jgi:amino acid transporter